MRSQDIREGGRYYTTVSGNRVEVEVVQDRGGRGRRYLVRRVDNGRMLAEKLRSAQALHPAGGGDWPGMTERQERIDGLGTAPTATCEQVAEAMTQVAHIGTLAAVLRQLELRHGYLERSYVNAAMRRCPGLRDHWESARRSVTRATWATPHRERANRPNIPSREDREEARYERNPPGARRELDFGGLGALTMNYGEMPPLNQFVRRVSRGWKPYPMVLVGEDEAVGQHIVNQWPWGDQSVRSFVPRQYPHKYGIIVETPEAMHAFLMKLVEMNNHGNEDAGNLASAIMGTLGFEWI